MPPLPPTTSPVAIATARILAAYLSNHDLSPAEAASLNGTIVETLLGLAREAPVTSHPVPRLAEEPTPRRRTKVQANWQASAEAEPTAPETEFVAEAEAGSELEAEAMAEPDDSPVPLPDPGWASEPDAPAEAAEAADLPRKRKRPSRPRSRRGQVATPPTASEAPSDDEPQVGPPETEPYRTQSEMAVTPGLADADADVPAEGEEIAPKPRRMPNRARRTTTS